MIKNGKSDEQQSDGNKEKPKRCLTCYFDICMLTPFMAKMCGGPFKDKQDHLDFVEREIVRKGGK